MRISLTTENTLAGARLKERIIKTINGDYENITVDMWSYIKSGDGFDIIYHNLDQYVNDPAKNVLFRVEIDGSNVVLSSAWWAGNETPSREIMCLHIGRLTEMLLNYFSDAILKFNIYNYN